MFGYASIGAPSGSYKAADGVRRPAGVVADHDAVGVAEVLDCRALLEELRTRDVGERPLPCSAKRRMIAVPSRTGRSDFITSAWPSLPADGCGSASTTACTVRQIGVAGVRRRGADGDEKQARGSRRTELCREVQTLAIARQHPRSRPGS